VRTAFLFGGVLQAPVGRVLCVDCGSPSTSLKFGCPEHLRQAATVSPLELDSELEIVANHGLCLMRQNLWMVTPAASEIRVTCIEALPRVPLVFGTWWNSVGTSGRNLRFVG
jgi:hypothetical protein